MGSLHFGSLGLFLQQSSSLHVSPPRHLGSLELFLHIQSRSLSLHMGSLHFGSLAGLVLHISPPVASPPHFGQGLVSGLGHLVHVGPSLPGHLHGGTFAPPSAA